MFEFYKVDNAYNAAKSTAKKYDLFAQWLGSDIQSSQMSANDVIRHINKIKEGKMQKWERAGNAFILSIDVDGAIIKVPETNYFKPKIPVSERISLNMLQQLLEGWREFIKSNKREMLFSWGKN